MAILRNLPANIVSEIGVKVQFATHEEWRQNLGNGLWSDQVNFLNSIYNFRCQKYVKKGTWKRQKKFTLRL